MDTQTFFLEHAVQALGARRPRAAEIERDTVLESAQIKLFANEIRPVVEPNPPRERRLSGNAVRCINVAATKLLQTLLRALPIVPIPGAGQDTIHADPNSDRNSLSYLRGFG